MSLLRQHISILEPNTRRNIVFKFEIKKYKYTLFATVNFEFCNTMNKNQKWYVYSEIWRPDFFPEMTTYSTTVEFKHSIIQPSNTLNFTTKP